METQKLILAIILINLVTGFGLSIAQDTQSETQLSQEIQNYDSVEQTFFNDANSQENIEAQTDYQYEKTAGDTIGWGTILQALFKGLNPLSLHPNMFDDYVSKALAFIIALVRTGLLGVLLAIEAYNVIKNRKSS